jgi:cytochrome c biogenesis protein ResB
VILPGKSLRLLASLKVAIPLLVLLTVVTIVGSLFPSPDFFRSPWYLSLLGLQGVSLLLVTLQHAPQILKKKGRNALLGVIATHLGILVLIAGVIYGGFSGFRHDIKLIEGEVAVLPGLPFAIELNQLVVENYRQEEFPRMNLDILPKKRQESHLTLLRQGKPWQSVVVAPGSPARVDGITLLPAINEIGWYFELIVVDPTGRPKAIPVSPWDPPLIKAGGQEIVVHPAARGDIEEVELFALVGHAGREKRLIIGGSEFKLGQVKRFTAMQVYTRPQEPILVLGCILMFLGLVWHFYFRHRDRKREGKSDA